MKKPIRIICVVVIFLAIAAGGFFAGRASVKDSFADGYAQTFYATVEQIGDSWLLVEGLEVNDINHRGAFTLSVSEKTRLVWRYTELLFEELKVGQTVAVTYTGPVLESYPARITTTLRIELLDDSKEPADSPEPESVPDVVTVVDIVDLTKSGELCTADALEGFWRDDEYTYYFGSIKSHYVIVHYSDGTEQPVREAMAEGRVTLADLDRFDIGYWKEPRIYAVKIEDRDTGDTAIDVFFTGMDYYYYFPSIHETVVHYNDGTSQPLKEAMAEFRVTVEELDRLGLQYSKAPVKTVAELEYKEGVLDALGHFWSDLVFDYYFPCYDTAVTVVFTDGTKMDLTEALDLGFVSPEILDQYDIRYYREIK